jgi:hypothetical protein
MKLTLGQVFLLWGIGAVIGLIGVIMVCDAPINSWEYLIWLGLYILGIVLGAEIRHD